MANTFFNLQSGTLTADPGAAGTTLNSAAFANLPTITAPDTLRLTLDPDGALGLPEIVLVTAHTAANTALTVTRGQEVGFGGNAGLGHAIGTVWRCSATRLDWEELPARKVTTKGDILAASAANTVTRLGVGADTTRLVADSSQATGLRYAAETELKIVAAKGDLTPGTANDTIAVLTVGANDTRLVADSTQATGLRYAPDTELKLVAAKGDLLAGTANDTIAVLTAGANDTRLVADSAQASGLRYAPDTELKLIAAKGDLLVGTANDTLAVKSVGADKSFLMADAASAGGVKWNTGALPTWAPTISQGGVVTYAANAFQTRVGRMVTLEGIFTITGSGTGPNFISLDLPVAADAAWVSDYGTLGDVECFDTSTGQLYGGHVTLASTTAVKFRYLQSTLAFIGTSGVFTAGLAINDIISVVFTYPAAAD